MSDPPARRPQQREWLVATRYVLAAIEAVEETQVEASSDPVLANQLESALARLREMLAEVDGGRVQPDSAWLGQMVADQWDPSWPVTDRVLLATQAFGKRPR